MDNEEPLASSNWFWDHYEVAVKEMTAFCGGDNIFLSGKDIADIGSGDGILSAGTFKSEKPRSLVGFDVQLTNIELLKKAMKDEGVDEEIPEGLSFQQSFETGIPAGDSSFDFVMSWSAFEHIRNPIQVLQEIRRVIKQDGVLFIQIWPLFHSQHGSHLWDWYPDGWAQHTKSFMEIEEKMNNSNLLHGDESNVAYMKSEYDTLNRLTIDDLQRALLTAGFSVEKVELQTDAFHVPRELQHYPLSKLAVSGVKLLATPMPVIEKNL
jgi:ubiquinone/menaquinone biosynthesis C-methylase UbiE